MSSAVRNRLLALGVLWGLCLAVTPAFIMVDPLRSDGFLVAAVMCALLSGTVGTLAAVRGDAARPQRIDNAVLGGLGTSLSKWLVGGGVAALLFWGIMALTISGFLPGRSAEISTLMHPQVFLGSFFVSLSVFLYALVGGVLLDPVFGTLVNRVAKTGGKGELRWF